MAIGDTFPKASFGGIQFPYTGIKIKGSLDHHVHKYIHRPGGELETLGRHVYEVSFTCVFDTSSKKWLNLYPGILAQLITLFESEVTADLVIPNRGMKAMKAKLTSFDSNYTAKIRSGEGVEFHFTEDSTDQFTPFKIAALAKSDLASRVLLCQQLALAYKLPNPSIFDELSAAISTFQNALAQIDNYAYQAISAIANVIALCDALMLFPDLLDPVNCEVYLAFVDVYDSSLQIALDVTGDGRTVDVYFVAAPTSVTELSLTLYGDPGHVTDLLSVNSFNDPFLIPAASLVNYFVP